MKRIATYISCIIALLATSCSGSDSAKYNDYIAVKLSGSESWSIIKTNDGEIVASDEFKERPSVISNDGFFYLRNSDGTYDFYNVGDLNKPVNKDPYYDAIAFSYNNVTPVVKEGETITIIDKSFKEVAKLDKSIKKCYIFSNGYAIIEDADGNKGFIDEKGKTIVKPKYAEARYFTDGVAIVMTKSATTESDTNSVIDKYIAIDTKGNELFSLKSNAYTSVGVFSHGYLPVVKDDQLIYLDKKGEKVFKVCTVGSYGYIAEVYRCTFDGKYIIFVNNNIFGVKDKDNNTIIRAKYDALQSIGDGEFIAIKDGKWGVINAEDNTILDFDYKLLYNINRNVFIAENSKTYSLIGSDGKEICKEDFTDISVENNEYVVSNYIDTNEYAQELISHFTANSFEGYTSDMTARDFRYEIGNSPYYYSNVRTYSTYKNGSPIVLYFNDYLSKPEYTYSYWGSYYSGMKMNYDARLIGFCEKFDINEYPIFENEIAKECGNDLERQVYTKQDNGYYKSKDGNLVGLGYDDGTLTLYYFFGYINYIPLSTNLRTSKRSYVSEYDYACQDTILTEEICAVEEIPAYDDSTEVEVEEIVVDPEPAYYR